MHLPFNSNGRRILSMSSTGIFLFTMIFAGSLQAAGPGSNPPAQGGGPSSGQGSNSGKGQQKPQVSPRPSPSPTPNQIQPKENTTQQAIRG